MLQFIKKNLLSFFYVAKSSQWFISAFHSFLISGFNYQQSNMIVACVNKT